MNNHNYVASKLKTIADKQGPNIFLDNPYMVYEKIKKDKKIDEKISLSLLCFFASKKTNKLNNIQSADELSVLIQNDLGFNENIAGDLSKVINILYSTDNKNSWKTRKNEGLIAFQKENFKLEWSEFEEWDAGSTVLGLKCYADIELKPLKKIENDKNIKSMIKRNSFITKKEISDYFKKKLCDYLSDEFSEFCHIDDYYPPDVDEFYIDSYLEVWCKEYGFKLIKCDSEGEDSGYEPKHLYKYLR